MKIKCKNMTQAMKANRLLNNSGISSRVEKISNDLQAHGCIYSICFDSRYRNEALSVMCEGGVELHRYENTKYGDNCV